MTCHKFHVCQECGSGNAYRDSDEIIHLLSCIDKGPILHTDDWASAQAGALLGCDTGRAKQVGGDHYAKHKIQPWDVIEEYDLDYFEGSVLKYLLRRKVDRLEDLRKAAHYLEKAIEREERHRG